MTIQLPIPMSVPAIDPPPRAHRLNMRVLRFRTEPLREEPALLAQALLDSGRHDEALEMTTEALRRDPADADLWLMRGRALARTGQLESAQHALMQAARGAEDWAEPWGHLADVLMQRGRPEQALAVAERGLSLERENATLQAVRRAASLTVRYRRFAQHPEDEEPTMLAQELLAAGRADDAFEVTRTALLSEFDDADLLVTHARAARARGDLEEAHAALVTASFEAPEWVEVWRLLAEVQAELNEPTEALASAARAVALDPTDPELLGLHAHLEQRAGIREDRELDHLLDTLSRRNLARSSIPRS